MSLVQVLNIITDYWTILTLHMHVGKTSLKKTLFSEPYNPEEKPTSGIIADMSVTRIQCKQFREWVQQPSSIADSYRLNLEYTDNLISYILDDIKKPKVYDDAVDGTAFQTEKGPAKSVRFATHNMYIAPDNRNYAPLEEDTTPSKDAAMAATSNGVAGEAGGVGVVKGPAASIHDFGSADGARACSPPEAPELAEKNKGLNILQIEGDEATISVDPSQMNRIDGVKEEQEAEEVVQDDDRLSRFAKESDNTADSHPDAGTPQPMPVPTQPQVVEATPPQKQPLHSTFEVADKGGKPEPSRSGNEIQESLFPKSRELTRLLVEKIPVEILKRIIMRWPVQEEHTPEQTWLCKDRMAITIWDAAGDPLQQNFVPFFFTNHSIYIVLYNLREPFDALSPSCREKNLCCGAGHVPTNAEVMEDWIGCITAFAKPIPSEPFRCTKKTPVLPPLILTCSHDDDVDNGSSVCSFDLFFSRSSFNSYCRHLVDSKYPSAVRISNKLESYSSEDDSSYCGHHILRREIDYLARQMPYAQESIPVQWVKFEQLVYGLLEQRKVVLLYDDMAKYISEHCNLTGLLQVLPMLSYYHDVGVLVFFYRHPRLKKLVIVKPQWLIDALASVITSASGKWITDEVQDAFKNLTVTGTIQRDIVALAYRCAHLPSRHWNEFLFVLSCMDLVCCHPCLHEQKSLYIPCMVVERAPPDFFVTTEKDPSVLRFSCSGALPVALYNQLVTCCIRNSQYAANIFSQNCHVRLNQSHHLIVRKEHSSIDFLVQPDSPGFCSFCRQSDVRYPVSSCSSHIKHLLGDGVEILPSDIVASLCDQRDVQCTFSLALSDSSLHDVCVQVLSFLSHTLDSLCECWFPGLKLQLTSNGVILDQYWKHTVLRKCSVAGQLAVWFE